MRKKESKKVISIRLDSSTIAEIRLNKGYTAIIRQLVCDYIALNKVANGSTFKDAYLMQVSCKNGTSEATAEQQGADYSIIEDIKNQLKIA